MKKKVFSSILALTMVLSMVGCGQKEQESVSNHTDTQKESKVEVENSKNEEVPTLKFYMINDPQTDLEAVVDAANEILVEEVGCEIDLVFVDGASYNEKMTMAMASGEAFDLIWVGYALPMADAAEKGGLMPLDDLLETTPALVDAISDAYWAASTYDGHTYAVGCQQIIAQNSGIMVPKELAEKYELDIDSINKLVDIEPFLQTLVENEPDIYPFRATDFDRIGFMFDLEASDYWHSCAITEGVYFQEKEDGTYRILSVLDEEFSKEDLARARQVYDWYQKGYIRSDVASVLDDTQERVAGKYGAWVAVNKPGVEGEYLASLGYECVAIPYNLARVGINDARTTMISIGANSRYPELAIKVIEQLHTNVELYNILVYGLEGKHYERIDENYISKIADSGYSNSAWKMGTVFNAYLTEGQPLDLHSKTKQMNEESYVTPLQGFVFDNSAVKTEIAQVKTVADEYKFLNNGSKNPDEYWDEYVGKMKQAGLEKVYNEVVRQVEEFLNNK